MKIDYFIGEEKVTKRRAEKEIGSREIRERTEAVKEIYRYDLDIDCTFEDGLKIEIN